METLEFVPFIGLNINLESSVCGKARKCASNRKSIQRSKDEKGL